MIVFIGMETSGALRRRFQALGHETYSADLLPSEDGGEEMAYDAEGRPLGRHLVGDVFDTLNHLKANDLWPDLAIFHPTCTYLTGSAAWAFKDGPYHQKVKPTTLVGAARREARERALDDVVCLMGLDIDRIAIENPVGVISSRIRQPDQIIHPWQFGHGETKATCLWLKNLPPLYPTQRVEGREARIHNMPPSEDRGRERSRTYEGIARAMAEQWSGKIHVQRSLV